MSSQHHATFNWGAGPQTVFIAGSFNDWSDTAATLKKQPDGTFAGDVPMPWGEKQAFKYVVDGEWKIREDEAKEWDAAGNMNNVYTAPHAPASTGSGPAARSAPAAAITSDTSGTSAPPATAPDTQAPTLTNNTTEPATLMTASAPPASSGGGGYVFGAVVGGGSSSSTKGLTPVPATSSTYTKSDTASAPMTNGTTGAAPTTFDPTPVQIGETAASSSVDETQTAEEQPKTYIGSAMAALGVIVGGAAVAVEKATGVDLMPSHQPMSVPEAEAKGINVDSLPQMDGPTDTTSPAGTKPSTSGVAALEEKMDGLKTSDASETRGVTDGPLPSGGASTTSNANSPSPLPEEETLDNDIPSQVETTDNHTHIPQPVITDLSERDPKKDRSLNSTTNADSISTKPVSSDPAVDAKSAKADAETQPFATGSTGTTANDGVPSGTSIAKPDAKSANVDAPPPSASSPSTGVTGLGDAGTIPSASKADQISAAAATTSPGTAETITPSAVTPTSATQEATPSNAVAATVVPPTTPSKNVSPDAPPSPATTFGGTPSKPATNHKKESTDASDMRKRKSFFGRIKHAFKDKK